ncbi:MAG: hypothetical protein AAFQ94_04005 [Bacteroidota bacterium]
MHNRLEESEEFKDELVAGIVKKEARMLPNPDFGNDTMLKIQEAAAYKKEVSARLKASLWCFLGALAVGITLGIVVIFGELFTQLGSNKVLTILGLFSVTLIGILGLDNYRRLIKRYS